MILLLLLAKTTIQREERESQTYFDNEYKRGKKNLMCRQRPDHTEYLYAGNIHFSRSQLKPYPRETHS